MKKLVFTLLGIMMLNAAAFAGTCARTGNGHRATVTCDCSNATACAIAQGVINSLKKK